MFFFDAFSSREPGSTPHQVRAGFRLKMLWLTISRPGRKIAKTTHAKGIAALH
jgi:hypothetical protein